MIYTLLENTGPHCNYKIIVEGTGDPQRPPPLTGDAPELRYRQKYDQ